MNKTEFVTNLIQHDEDFPNLKPIDLAAAQKIISHLDPSAGLPVLTAEELMEAWNNMLQDPDIMQE